MKKLFFVLLIISYNLSWACPEDMIQIQNFCIDRFEAPNEEGTLPFAGKTALEGEAWCAGRGKRLCTENEWMRACQGRSKKNYPYGTTYVRSRCNDDKVWKVPNWNLIASYPAPAGAAELARLYQADPSGSRSTCLSEDGVYDLTGNVVEWVTRSYPNRTNNKHVMKGCYWVGCSPVTPPSCGYTNIAHPGSFRSYEAGFRCCSRLK
jgi:formylglycine-generating enzyme required for sulfatase activity